MSHTGCEDVHYTMMRWDQVRAMKLRVRTGRVCLHVCVCMLGYIREMKRGGPLVAAEMKTC